MKLLPKLQNKTKHKNAIVNILCQEVAAFGIVLVSAVAGGLVFAASVIFEQGQTRAFCLF